MCGAEEVRPEILVVDDEPCVLGVLCSILRHYGYEVLSAASAEQALVVFRAHPRISLVIIDVVLPGMSGPDLARALSGLQPRLPVLFTAGMPDTPIIHSLTAEGFAFLAKPYTPEVLIERVRGLLVSSSAA